MDTNIKTLNYTTLKTKDAKDKLIIQRGIYGYTYIKHRNKLIQKYKIDILDEPKHKKHIVLQLFGENLK